MSTWLFAHGSLMAEPPFAALAAEPASVDGWTRTFGHPSVRNWGTPAAPAPTSALVAGGAVHGMAYLVDDQVVERINRREAMPPMAITARIDESMVAATAWVMDARWAHLGPMHLAERAIANVSAGGGPFGDALDYLAIVRRALSARGAIDAVVEAYHAACSQIRRERVPSGTAEGTAERDETL